MKQLQNLLLELDKLKSVYRRTYITDGSRNENSAEHSWHLAVALLAIRDVIPSDVNFNHVIKMALLHDVCEIGAGDISVYDPNRSKKTEDERNYVNGFATKYGPFGNEVADLWQEYEDQVSKESNWVKTIDRLLPFLLNLATEGKAWKEQRICRTQVLELHQSISVNSPEIYNWMVGEIENAVESGWLEDA